MTLLSSRVPMSALLLFLLLLAPRAGLAAGDAPLAAEAPSPTERSLTLEGDEHAPSMEESTGWVFTPGRAPLGLRLLAEVGAGVATAAAGGLVAGIGGFGLCQATGVLYATEGGCFYALLFGAMAGMAVGYPVGVWWGGEVVGGDGRLWASLLGGGLGLAAGYLGSRVLIAQTGRGESLIAIPLLAMVGASLGYELSAARPSVQPLLSLDTRGGMLGLAGRF
ncbi:hypothetical protein D187_009265 [Cystobacter fuscus DSM 2262]|uniref:Uncharacterized protein n=1 Tax=Cystobacter fuscus (strain ATCC 25194 / DSM 2262 / NBRC 100088 / M29) TaxID=1242864 RepID=S9Q2Y6_CYSF2|nr:hypothetical protein [Cystobacter fuscus]EPX55654.1 hypothetical protein D187_009265 [Cystobacter fuscus DSM 2262]